MSEEPATSTHAALAAWYPSELAQDLDAALDNAVRLEPRRLRPGSPRLLASIALTADGAPVRHGQRTDASADELAARVYAACEADAIEHCGGHATYKVSLCYAKPPSGRTMAPRFVEVVIGTASEVDAEARSKSDLLGHLLVERKSIHDQHLALLRETTRLASSVSTMVTGLADAYARLHEQVGKVASETETRALVNAQMAHDAARLREFRSMLASAMPLIRAKLGVAEPASAPVVDIGIVGSNDSGATQDPNVALARSLVASLTAEQRSLCQTHCPELLEGEHVDDEASLLAAIAKIMAADMAKLLPVIDTFTADQQARFERLCSWAATR